MRWGQSHIVCALLIWLAAIATSAIAQNPKEIPAVVEAELPDPPTAESVRLRLEQLALALAAQALHPVMTVLTARATSKRPARVAARLAANTHLAFLAVCDSDCGRVALSLLDEKGNVLVRSQGETDQAIVNGVTDRAGFYEIELAVPGCRERICHVGLSILGEDAAAEVVAVVAGTSLDPSRAPGHLQSPIGLARQSGQRMDGSAFVQRSAQSIAQCELYCAIDQRCKAASFKRSSSACALFDRVGSVVADTDFDVGVKQSTRTR